MGADENKISRSQDLKIKTQDLKISRSRHKISRSHDLKISRSQDLEISRSQDQDMMASAVPRLQSKMTRHDTQGSNAGGVAMRCDVEMITDPVYTYIPPMVPKVGACEGHSLCKPNDVTVGNGSSHNVHYRSRRVSAICGWVHSPRPGSSACKLS